MGTITTLVVGGTAATPSRVTTVPGECRLDFILDMTKYLTKITANDVVQLFKVPDKAMVWGVGYEIITAAGVAASMTIGDTSDPDGFMASVSVNSTGSNITSTALTTGPAYTLGYGGGKYYTGTSNTIDAVFTSVDIPATSKFKVRFSMFYTYNGTF